MQYSDQYLAAYRLWQKDGSERISEADLLLIEKEDEATGDFIRRERLKAAEARAAKLRKEAEQLARAAAPSAAAKWTWDPTQSGEMNVERNKHYPVRLGLLMQAINPLIDFIKDMNAKNIQRNTRLDALEQRIADLEARPPALAWKGVWSDGTLYRRGECVTDHGSIWHCNQDTASRPMQSRDWTMCVSRGKPGKER